MIATRPLFRGAILVAALSILSFAYGVGVGRYGWFPFDMLQQAKQRWQPDRLDRHVRRGEEELFEFAFGGPLIAAEQLLGPCPALDDIQRLNRRLLFPAETALDCYSQLEIQRATTTTLDQGQTHLLLLEFRLGDHDLRAYAYHDPATLGRQQAALLIPGSGSNQSSAIYHDDPSSYHAGMREPFQGDYAWFVLVKPNQDCWAFHRDGRKLSDDYLIAWLLNRGGSYSAYYLAASVAVVKYLQGRYERVVVAGLSQGGRIALLTSLQSQPDATIVASGFSVITEKLHYAPLDRVIIPGLRDRWSMEAIRTGILHAPGRFLFTYGADENGIYRMEVEDRTTEQFLSGCTNVEVRYDEGDHRFPAPLTREFLSGAAAAR